MHQCYIRAEARPTVNTEAVLGCFLSVLSCFYRQANPFGNAKSPENKPGKKAFLTNTSPGLIGATSCYFRIFSKAKWRLCIT